MAARAGVEGAKSQYGANESFPIVEFDEKLQDVLDGAEKLYYRLGVMLILDDTIIRQIARMRSLNRKPIHPPQTIVDRQPLFMKCACLRVRRRSS